MRSSSSGLIFLLVISALALATLGWANPDATQEAAQVASEPSAPKPTDTVQNLLDEASQLAEAEQPQEALQAADRALAVAQQEKDLAGEALAQESRGRALEELDQAEEALAAWREGAAAWERAGDAPGRLESLGSAAALLLSMKKTAEAEPLLQQALALGRAEAKRPRAAAQALHNVGNYIFGRGVTLELKRKFYQAAVDIREKLIPDSLELANSLSDLANLVASQGDLVAAEQYHQRAMALRQKLAPNSLDMARSLHGLGSLERRRGTLAAAEEYDQRALALEEELVPDSVTVWKTLTSLGIDAGRQGHLAVAEEYFQRALALGKKLGRSKGVATSLNNLGIVAQEQGDLFAARQYYLRTLVIDEKLGPNTEGMAETVMNLGIVALEQGDYTAAQDYYRRALAILEKLAPDFFGMAEVLGSLGTVELRLGDLASARDYYQRSLAIFEKLAPNQAHGALILNNLGELELKQGDLEAGEKYYRRADAIYAKQAPDSLDRVLTLDNLGTVSRRKGDIQAAVEYGQRGLAIGEKAAPESLYVALSLGSLGETEQRRGNLAAASEFHRRALAIRQKVVGHDDPEIAIGANNLAGILAQMGENREAFEAALRAERVGRQHLSLTARSLPERQALLYASARASGLDLALTLAAERRDELPTAGRAVWDALIRSRALVLDEMAARHRTVVGAEDPEIARLAQELASARERLARLAVRGPGDDPPERYRSLLDRARQEKEEAERALAEKSRAFRQEQARSRLGLEEVVATLSPDSALVAFVHYERHEFTQTRPAGKPPEPIPSYLAFVLRGGESEPAVVLLGPAEEIESLVSRLRQQIAQEALAPGRASKRTEAAYRRVGTALRRKVWDPVASHLRGAKRVFIVPDGALHLVNLAALPMDTAEYLIEAGPLIHYLSAERDLVQFGTQAAKGEGLLALGDPAFNETKLFAALLPEGETPERSGLVQVAALHSFRGKRAACGEFQSMRFEPLPASAREVEEIVVLWKKGSGRRQKGDQRLRGPAQETAGNLLHLRGAAASEAAFKANAPGKRVLHLATHGFFLGGRCRSALEVSEKPREQREVAHVTGENPLLLAGLALAGANHRQAATPEEEDGILTAEEIASLDLSGVEWAVLSACDTGVGEVKVGEGVLGLRRAFQVAGARTLIMSLWPVEDEAVRQWMTALYDRRFLQGQGTAEAVYQASLEILRQRQAKHQSTHPFYWASFVAAGDWH